MEKTVARDPLTTARDDVSERSECRRAIIGQTCGRDDSFETTEAGKKQKSPFLPLEWERDVKKWTNGAVFVSGTLPVGRLI